eukprot:1911540-Pleurochrysis_carterae.AAC.3
MLIILSICIWHNETRAAQLRESADVVASLRHELAPEKVKLVALQKQVTDVSNVRNKRATEAKELATEVKREKLDYVSAKRDVTAARRGHLRKRRQPGERKEGGEARGEGE